MSAIGSSRIMIFKVRPNTYKHISIRKLGVVSIELPLHAVPTEPRVWHDEGPEHVAVLGEAVNEFLIEIMCDDLGCSGTRLWDGHDYIYGIQSGLVQLFLDSLRKMCTHGSSRTGDGYAVYD